MRYSGFRRERPLVISDFLFTLMKPVAYQDCEGSDIAEGWSAKWFIYIVCRFSTLGGTTRADIQTFAPVLLRISSLFHVIFRLLRVLFLECGQFFRSLGMEGIYRESRSLNAQGPCYILLSVIRAYEPLNIILKNIKYTPTSLKIVHKKNSFVGINSRDSFDGFSKQMAPCC